ncbi:MAG: AAA family ATPase [Thermodesulfovibrionales bacterium]|nr:AAA family ATPase [Thermodesulfovibrionales bacterium]
MSFVIAFAGKGGTGKTTLCGLTIRFILERRRGPVLAVDADSNSCLNETLGVEVHTTVGRLREESLQKVRTGDERPGGMSMEQLFDYMIQQCLIEAKGFDLLVMGRPEGPGCYCAANNIIRKYTDRLSEHYPYVVIDNEAGMEHLSRRTTHNVDILFIVSDATKKGILTAKRINELVDELNLDVRSRYLIINRVSEDPDSLISLAREFNLNIAGWLPDDPLVQEYDLKGTPVIQLPEDSGILKKFYGILERLI